ncbi:hypothetical protein THTE_0438 [Thermogutta terrifontis]|uniref:Uncharacterized protein n=1 Tax=Thermogutta terrifontis TaxID=1331910 RepID=A0A286RAR0_9BACT|nr:hypothetical protein THTE_0438 [Thermogutta terrifontis]
MSALEYPFRLRLAGTTSVPLRTISRRDPLVRSVYQHSMIHLAPAGTEVPRGKRGGSPALHGVRRFIAAFR